MRPGGGTDPERELVERGLAGDPFGNTPGVASPWGALTDRVSPFVRRAIARTLRRYDAPEDESTVSDILQETFLTLFRDDAAALRAFQWDCPLHNYLASLATHRTIDWLRKHKPRAESVPGAKGRERLETEVVGERLELREQVLQGLERLPERERAVVHLHYWGALPTEAIARLLRLNPDSVRVFLSRARARLREHLRDAFLLML